MTLDHESLPHHWVNRLGFLLRRALQDRFRAIGEDVTPEEWAVLLFLWQDDDRTPGDLAARTVRDPTTMTRLLDGMVRKGMISRHADAEDRRRSRIRLTPRGRDLQAILVPEAKALIARSMRGVGATDMATTVKVLRAISRNMTNDEDPA